MELSRRAATTRQRLARETATGAETSKSTGFVTNAVLRRRRLAAMGPRGTPGSRRRRSPAATLHRQPEKRHRRRGQITTRESRRTTGGAWQRTWRAGWSHTRSSTCSRAEDRTRRPTGHRTNEKKPRGERNELTMGEPDAKPGGRGKNPDGEDGPISAFATHASPPLSAGPPRGRLGVILLDLARRRSVTNQSLGNASS